MIKPHLTFQSDGRCRVRLGLTDVYARSPAEACLLVRRYWRSQMIRAAFAFTERQPRSRRATRRRPLHQPPSGIGVHR